MNANIITDATFPHGTPQGFGLGCHGSHCPSTVSCRDVHTKYAGDYTYRRLIDQGNTSQDIHDAEQAAHAQRAAEAHAARKAEQAATREAARQRHNANRRRARGTRTGVTGAKKGDGVARTPLQLEIARMHRDGMTDLQMAAELGKTRNQVKGVRLYLLLTPNPAPATTGAPSLEAT